MESRNLGSTTIRVSVLGFGAGRIGDASLSEREVESLLHTILDSGINLIDTARGYGLSEERIGRHLKSRRAEFVLSTKVGYGIAGYEDWTGPCIAAGIDQALRLLQTDCIDVVHLHSCPLHILQHGGVIEPLLKAKAAGKIRAAAYSGDNEPFDWALQSGLFDSLQTSFNVCDQRSGAGAAMAAAKGIGIIAKRPLANTPWRHAAPPEGDDEAAKEYWHRWQAMQLDNSGMEWSELALRFALFSQGITACITGTASREHLLHNASIAGRGPLPDPLVQRIRSAFRGDWTGRI